MGGLAAERARAAESEDEAVCQLKEAGAGEPDAWRGRGDQEEEVPPRALRHDADCIAAATWWALLSPGNSGRILVAGADPLAAPRCGCATDSRVISESAREGTRKPDHFEPARVGVERKLESGLLHIVPASPDESEPTEPPERCHHVTPGSAPGYEQTEDAVAARLSEAMQAWANHDVRRLRRALLDVLRELEA